VCGRVDHPRSQTKDRGGFSEILPYAGAEVGGMLPAEIQLFTTFSIGVHRKDSAPAEALIRFLTTPAAREVIKV
jgi:hypothetical protein